MSNVWAWCGSINHACVPAVCGRYPVSPPLLERVLLECLPLNSQKSLEVVLPQPSCGLFSQLVCYPISRNLAVTGDPLQLEPDVQTFLVELCSVVDCPHYVLARRAPCWLGNGLKCSLRVTSNDVCLWLPRLALPVL